MLAALPHVTASSMNSGSYYMLTAEFLPLHGPKWRTALPTAYGFMCRSGTSESTTQLQMNLKTCIKTQPFYYYSAWPSPPPTPVKKEMALFFFLEEVYADESNKENSNQLVVLVRILDSEDTDNCYHECFIENVIFLFSTMFSSRKFIQLEENYFLRNEVSGSVLSHFLTCQVLLFVIFKNRRNSITKAQQVSYWKQKKNV